MKKIILLFLLFVFSLCKAVDRNIFFLVKLFDDYRNFSRDENENGGNNSKERSRYKSIISDKLKQKFSSQILVTHTFSTKKAFDQKAQQVDLSTHIFGDNPLILSDIFLPALLASNDKFVVPDGSSDCKNLCDQFLPQLADLELSFDAKQSITTLDLSWSYRFEKWFKNYADVLIGGNFPIVYQRRALELSLLRGGLSDSQLLDSGSSIELFFKEFNSVQDFVTGFVFDECKDLSFKREQNKVGLGDIAIFTAVDFGKNLSEKSLAIIGLNFLLPTSEKTGETILWQAELGNGGAWLINPFLRFDVPVINFFNPSLSLAGFFSPEFNAIRRIPQLKELSEEVTGLETDLCLPSRLCSYSIKPFSSEDSVSALLSDQAFCVKIKHGSGAMIRFGNNMHNLLEVDGLEAGLFYNFSIKSGNCIKVQSIKRQVASPFENQEETNKLVTTEFETCALNETHRSYLHALEWRISYQTNDFIKFSMGSWHTITGENITKTNVIFGKLTFYF